MLETIDQYAAYLERASLLSYPISLFLGFLAGAGALSCYLPVVPAMIGFIGGRQMDRTKLLMFPIMVMFGSILVLGMLGVIVSLFGLALQTMIGPYWGYGIGIICILAGLSMLRLLKMPRLKLPELKYQGVWAPLLFGMVVGGGIGFGSSCCVPTLPIVLTYAGIQGNPLHGALVLSSFAVGQSIPIFAISFFSGALNKITTQWSFYVHKISGVLLIGSGIYLILWRN